MITSRDATYSVQLKMAAVEANGAYAEENDHWAHLLGGRTAKEPGGASRNRTNK